VKHLPGALRAAICQTWRKFNGKQISGLRRVLVALCGPALADDGASGQSAGSSAPANQSQTQNPTLTEGRSAAPVALQPSRGTKPDNNCMAPAGQTNSGSACNTY
jgi:hypothetical protein